VLHVTIRSAHAASFIGIDGDGALEPLGSLRVRSPPQFHDPKQVQRAKIARLNRQHVPAQGLCFNQVSHLNQIQRTPCMIGKRCSARAGGWSAADHEPHLSR
jgi:hypothetical protein